MASKTVAAPRNGLTPGECVGESIRSTPEQVTRTCIHDGESWSTRPMPSFTGAAGSGVRTAPGIGTAEPAPVDHLQEVCRFISRWLERNPPQLAAASLMAETRDLNLSSRLGDTVDRLFPGPASHNPAALASILDEVSATAEASKGRRSTGSLFLADITKSNAGVARGQR